MLHFLFRVFRKRGLDEFISNPVKFLQSLPFGFAPSSPQLPAFSAPISTSPSSRFLFLTPLRSQDLPLSRSRSIVSILPTSQPALGAHFIPAQLTTFPSPTEDTTLSFLSHKETTGCFEASVSQRVPCHKQSATLIRDPWGSPKAANLPQKNKPYVKCVLTCRI